MYGKNLRAALKKHNISHNELARELKVSPQSIWRWANCGKHPKANPPHPAFDKLIDDFFDKLEQGVK